MATRASTKSGTGRIKTYSFQRYQHDILNQAEYLSPDEERRLGLLWRDEQDSAARERLVASHLRLASKEARSYLGGSGHEEDVLSVATIGLLKAVDRFDPDKGRLATLAMPWIQAELNEYTISQRDPIKTVTTKATRKVFFNLAEQRRRVGALDDAPLTQSQLSQVAASLSNDKLSIKPDDVAQVDQNRIKGLFTSTQGITSDGSEMEDQIPCTAPGIERQISSRRTLTAVARAFAELNPRAQYIIEQRRDCDEPKPLHELAAEFGVSCERIRQIEEAALKKLRQAAGLDRDVAKPARRRRTNAVPAELQ